ncbi:MAG: hypothetical protein QXN23_05960 [Candidatus Caldarchaeum sp.]
MDEVHILCDYLGFTDPEDTLRWIEAATDHDIETALSEAKKRRKKRRQDAAAYEPAYVYAY